MLEHLALSGHKKYYLLYFVVIFVHFYHVSQFVFLFPENVPELQKNTFM